MISQFRCVRSRIPCAVSTHWSYVTDSSVSRLIISSLTYSVLIIFVFCFLKKKIPTSYFLSNPSVHFLDMTIIRRRNLCLYWSPCFVYKNCVASAFSIRNMFPQDVGLIWIKWFCRLWRTFVYLINDEVNFDTMSLWYTRTCAWSTLLNNWFLLYHFLSRILCLLFQRARFRYCSNETFVDFVTCYCN